MDNYSKEVLDILRWCRMGNIACIIADATGTTPLQALKKFYHSTTCKMFHDRSTGLYIYSDKYIAEDYLMEIGERGSEDGTTRGDRSSLSGEDAASPRVGGYE